MRNILNIFISLLLFLVIAVSGFSQPHSEYALIRNKIFSSPEIWEINKSVTNEYLNCNLFSYPRSGVFAFDMNPYFTTRSSFTGILDASWNRLIYSDMHEDFVKASGSFGSGNNQVKWPKSIDAMIIGDGETTTNIYDIFIADTYNSRICKASYSAITDEVTWGTPITGNGLYYPIDVCIDYLAHYSGNSYENIWVLNGDNRLLCFDINGNLEHEIETPEGCYASAIAVPRYFSWIYVADTSDNKIYKYEHDVLNDIYIKDPAEGITTSSIVALDFDGVGYLWALDKNGTFTKYGSDLTPLCTFGSSGTGINQFFDPSGFSFAKGPYGVSSAFITEPWSDTTGIQRYDVGVDILNDEVTSNAYQSIHTIYCWLIEVSTLEVAIFDDVGVKVKTLREPLGRSAGDYSIIWDGTNDSDEPVLSGVYTYWIKSESWYVNIETGEPSCEMIKTGTFSHVTPCCILRGDVAIPKDGVVLVGDIVWLVDFLFRGGDAPECMEEGDIAIPLDGSILANDIVWLVDFLFRGGTAPPPC